MELLFCVGVFRWHFAHGFYNLYLNFGTLHKSNIVFWSSVFQKIIVFCKYSSVCTVFLFFEFFGLVRYGCETACYDVTMHAGFLWEKLISPIWIKRRHRYLMADQPRSSIWGSVCLGFVSAHYPCERIENNAYAFGCSFVVDVNRSWFLNIMCTLMEPSFFI